MATRYLAPTALGTGDGSSAANAANYLTAFDTQAGLAGPGGEVIYLAGTYTPTVASTPFMFTNGGTAGNPLTIRGQNPTGTIMRGVRSDPWFPGGADGDPCFRMTPTANYMTFKWFEFQGWGLGCISNIAGTTTTGLWATENTVYNVMRYIEIAGTLVDSVIGGQLATPYTTTETIDTFVDYYTKGIVRLQGDSHDVLIKDITGDAHHVDGDPIPFGFQCVGTVHDVTYINCHSHNNINTDNPYWNGDGFVTEEAEDRITFIDCSSNGNADAGFDLKGNRQRLVRCSVDDSKRSYRLWGNGVILENCVGTNPHLRGGIGNEAQVHLSGGGSVQGVTVDVINCTFTGGGPDLTVYQIETGPTGRLVVTNSTHEVPPGADLSFATTGTTITIQTLEGCD